MSTDPSTSRGCVAFSHGAPMLLGNMKLLAPNKEARRLFKARGIKPGSRAAIECLCVRRDENDAAIIRQLEPLAESMFRDGGPGVDNKRIPAGYTYFGQFISHEINFHPSAQLLSRPHPEKQVNLRTASLDLDSLYGLGPDEAPYMYEHGDDGRCTYRFLVDRLARSHELDLPRNREGRALIGDPRNDVHVIISQLHLAFLRFHNEILNSIAKNGKADSCHFENARRQVKWHFQWLVVRDFLPRLCGPEFVEELWPETLNGPPSTKTWKFYTRRQKATEKPFIPAEFAFAAFRFGHAMVRDSYRLTDKGFFSRAPIFAPGKRMKDLHGFKTLLRDWSVQWDKFCEVGNQHGDGSASPQFSRRIGPKLSQSLANLPGSLTDARDSKSGEMLSLRNLRMSHFLRPGQWWAKQFGLCGSDVLRKEGGARDGLWYYVLREAEEHPDGESGARLGPVGARMVAETIIGVLLGDQDSIAYKTSEDGKSAWSPTTQLGRPWHNNRFSLAELIKIAGLPRSAEEWLKYRDGKL